MPTQACPCCRAGNFITVSCMCMRLQAAVRPLTERDMKVARPETQQQFSVPHIVCMLSEDAAGMGA